MIIWKRLLLISITACLCLPASGARGNSLTDAMRALESDSFSTALELSANRESNPWLEVYRLCVRAEAFLSAGDSVSAAERAVSASRLVSSGEAEGHPKSGGLIDIAILCVGPEIALPFITDELLASLAPRSLLLMGRHYFELGDSSAAVSSLTLAARGRPGEEEMELLNELAGGGTLNALGVSGEIVAALTAAAISAGDYITAERLIVMVGSNGEDAWLKDILEGDLLSASGKRSNALARYRSVFRSGICPVDGKKKALQRLAALQYRMKRFSDSSASYKTYGLYYPNDPFAEMSTDRAARIEVASGRWRDAVDTWKRIADAGPKTLIGREAILGMAVSLERMGRKSEACKVLIDNLQGVRGRLRAAYLYWIVRTCSDEQLRSDHAMILSGESAQSFYARLLEDGPGFLTVNMDRPKLPSISRLSITTRKAPFPGTGTAVDHPSLGAFIYFAREGMKAAASECARGYIAVLEGKDESNGIGIIYGEAREAGIESLCLGMVVANPDLFTGREDYIEFLYPFAYGSEIDGASDMRSLPPEMVLAVIREESRFDENIMSSAGAYGLMQIMPSTGEWIGRKIGRKGITVSDLEDPGFNVAAGCWYLRFLLDRSEDSIVAALAAYNAGHGRMRSWKKKFRPQSDPLAALELIGPAETRRYVRRVLDSMAAYCEQTSFYDD